MKRTLIVVLFVALLAFAAACGHDNSGNHGGSNYANSRTTADTTEIGQGAGAAGGTQHSLKDIPIVETD